MLKYTLDTNTETLVFLHILKTAGQTLMPILEGNFPKGKTYFGNMGEVLELSPGDLDNYNLIMGHNFYGIKKLLSRKPMYITFLRDPIERTISHYYYLKRAKEHFLYPTVENMELDDFLRNPVTKNQVENFQVRWLISELALKPGIKNETFALNKALNRLKAFPFFGITEHFTESVTLLSYVFDWPYVSDFESKNIGQNRPKIEEIDPSLIEEIKALVPLDIELYNSALNIFNSRTRVMYLSDSFAVNTKIQETEQSIANLENELEALRKRNVELSILVNQLHLDISKSEALTAKYSQELYRLNQSWVFRMIGQSGQLKQKIYYLVRKVAKFLVPKNFRRYLRKFYFTIMRDQKNKANGYSLVQILEKHKGNEGIIVFPPALEWDAELFQRPQQMAKAFAELGYLVFYFSGFPDKNEVTKAFLELDKNLFLSQMSFSYFGKLVPDPVLILYSYNRHWEEYFEKPFIIYEQLDELEVFDGFSMKKLKSQHEQLVQNSNLVVGISDQLVSKLRQTRPDTLLITNGVDINHFSKDRMTNVFLGDVMDYILSKGKPIIGYYGALARWMDYDLIRYVANELRNDCLFLFIGPPYDHSFARSKVGDLENIHVLPPVKYQILPEYLDKFTVATIPFVVNELTNSVSPLKLFEYMAGEKPIVTTKMKECEKYEGVIIAENKEDYVSKVLQAIELGSDEMYLESLRKVAYKNSWQNKTKQLMVEIKKRKG